VARNVDLIEWVRGSMQVALRQVEVQGGVFQMCMAHQKLNGPKISSRSHQVGGEAVPERVRSDPFPDACSRRSLLARIPNGFVRDRLLSAAMTFCTGEQKTLRLLPPPVLAQIIEELRCHRNIAVAGSLALMDVDHHALTIDVADSDDVNGLFRRDVNKVGA
jgi:hypothetical protein